MLRMLLYLIALSNPRQIVQERAYQEGRTDPSVFGLNATKETRPTLYSVISIFTAHTASHLGAG
jgi:hypothetical protein